MYVSSFIDETSSLSNMSVRKTQRVADLRELLQKASVSIPAKANKADLIAKILASPAAIEVFNNPGSTATVAAAASKPKAPETSQAGQDDDLVSPTRNISIS